MLVGYKITAILLILSIIVSGCGSTIHRKASIDGIKTLSIDAKQRLVLVNEKGGPEQDRRVACAEPSPDALVAQAAALSANINTPSKLTAALSAANTETAGSIGVRTPTIQILRDGYYRLCEAYMNGSINKGDYSDTIDNIDGVIAVVLAIDTLGRTVVAPAVSLSPGAITINEKGNKTSVSTGEELIVFGNVHSESGKLSDAQAKAIENITIAYIDHVKWRALKRPNR